MDNSIESGDLDSQDSKGTSSDSYTGEANRIGKDFEIENPEDTKPFHLIDPEELEVWIRWNREETRRNLVQSTEETRQNLVHIIMQIYTVWFFSGLIFFVISGNIWLLASEGILTVPLGAIFYYYFRHPRE